MASARCHKRPFAFSCLSRRKHLRLLAGRALVDSYSNNDTSSAIALGLLGVFLRRVLDGGPALQCHALRPWNRSCHGCMVRRSGSPFVAMARVAMAYYRLVLNRPHLAASPD